MNCLMDHWMSLQMIGLMGPLLACKDALFHLPCGAPSLLSAGKKPAHQGADSQHCAGQPQVPGTGFRGSDSWPQMPADGGPNGSAILGTPEAAQLGQEPLA
jgi:hypothetical protein